MSTLRLESVLIGYVCNLVDLAVVIGVTETALRLQSFLLGAYVLEMAFFLSLDAVGGFVAVAVGAVRIGAIQSLPENGDWAGIACGGGYCHCHEGAQDNYLRRRF